MLKPLGEVILAFDQHKIKGYEIEEEGEFWYIAGEFNYESALGGITGAKNAEYLYLNLSNEGIGGVRFRMHQNVFVYENHIEAHDTDDKKWKIYFLTRAKNILTSVSALS